MTGSRLGLMLLATLLVWPTTVDAGQGEGHQLTFAKDVARIFQEKYQVCHQPDSIAPMSLLTYRDARPWARAIKQKVVSREMPPWHIDQNVGIRRFKNDRSLSSEQIDTPDRR